MNLFASLDLGRRALFAARVALDAAGNNIANVNTPGFSRRRVDVLEAPPTPYGGLLIGNGANPQRIVRIVDRLLEAQLRGEAENAARRGASASGLSEIERLVGQGSGAQIGPALSDLYSSLSGLSASADDAALRQNVAGKAAFLASAVRDTASGLQAARRSADTVATDAVTSVNSLLADIATLNRQIQVQEPGAGEASALRDQLDARLRDLSALVDIQVAGGTRGSVHVSLAGTGDTLVDEDSVFALSITRDSAGFARVGIPRGGLTVDVTDRVRGGSLGAQLELRDATIPRFIAQLDSFASDLIARVNAQHRAGFDLSGAAGGDFFAPTPPGRSAAETFSLSAAISADPSLIAAGASANPGDGANLLAMVALESQASAALGGRTGSEFFAALQTDAGSSSRSASSQAGIARLSLLSAENRRDGVSSVDLDEEATALLQYQRSYEAAARFISVVSDVTKIAIETFGV